LRRLPDGLDSYPECKSKGTMVLSAIEGHRLDDLKPGLPPRVAEMIASPPGAGFWIPAVMSDAVFFAMVDNFYPKEDAMLAWTRERTIRTAKSRLYRALTRLAGPISLLKIASAVHGRFQKGTDLDVLAYSDNSVSLCLRHPPYLHLGFNHLSNVALFEALVELSGVEEGRFEILTSEPEEARYEGRWT
jgi:hypothetical protein